MTHQKLEQYRAYLKKQQDEALRSIRILEEEGRQDEADLFKIRLNILQVFGTLSAVDERQSISWEDFCHRHLSRFHTLPAPWRVKLDAAQRYGDTAAQAIEETKLSTAAEAERFLTAIKE